MYSRQIIQNIRVHNIKTNCLRLGVNIVINSHLLQSWALSITFATMSYQAVIVHTYIPVVKRRVQSAMANFAQSLLANRERR